MKIGTISSLFSWALRPLLSLSPGPSSSSGYCWHCFLVFYVSAPGRGGGKGWDGSKGKLCFIKKHVIFINRLPGHRQSSPRLRSCALPDAQPFRPSLEHPPTLGPPWGHLQLPAAPLWLGDTGTSQAVMAGARPARQSPACCSVGQVPSCREPRRARRVVIHCSSSPAPGGKWLGSSHPESWLCPRGRAEGPLGLPVLPDHLSTSPSL